MAGLRFRIDVAAIQPLARCVGEMAAIESGALMPRLGFQISRAAVLQPLQSVCKTPSRPVPPSPLNPD